MLPTPSTLSPRSGETRLTPEQRAEINRANAQKSTGPRTPEGKARASVNARRHGLTGQFSFMFDEDYDSYTVHAIRLLHELKPVGGEEEQTAQFLIDTAWLIHRANACEINARTVDLMPTFNSSKSIGRELSDQEAVMAEVDAMRRDCTGSHSADWLGRHRVRLTRFYFRLRDHLKLLQKDRRALDAEIRALKVQHGAAYNAKTHGPFSDVGFDLSKCAALQFYLKTSNLNAKVLNLNNLAAPAVPALIAAPDENAEEKAKNEANPAVTGSATEFAR